MSPAESTSMRNITKKKEEIVDMPHSVTPESTAGEDSSTTVSQADIVKSEPETQDVAMDDAPSATETEKPKVNLEELFDDEDSDDEFPSSAPGVKSEEESSQPAPLYVQCSSSPYRLS
jgi:DNA primase small subunit